MNKIKDFARNNQYTTILIGLLIAVIVLFSALKGAAFWQVNLWKGMTMQFPEYACVALGLMFVFISGHHDMSQVLLGNFASIIAVMYMSSHVVDGMSNGQVGGVIAAVLKACVHLALLCEGVQDIRPLAAPAADGADAQRRQHQHGAQKNAQEGIAVGLHGYSVASVKCG